MALDSKTLAATALHRFGFGPRAGSIASVAADPRGAMLAELDRPGAGRIADSDLLTTGEAARAAFDFRQERKAGRLALRAESESKQAEAKKVADAAMAAGKSEMAQAEIKQMDGAPAATMQAATAKANPGPGIPQQIYLEEAKARFDSALNAEIGLVDRLTWFWSNHFCVSADKGQVRPLCGAYEREAIRANVLGKFSDMLLAVESHPAMLLYLDNARSIGPNSIAGLRRGKGINENLAREILELHTLGVHSGYSQEDVTNFAKVITGWTGRASCAWPQLQRRRIRAGPCSPPDVGEPLGDRKAYSDKTRSAFHRRRSATGAGRPAGKAISRHRRRSQEGNEDIGLCTGIVGCAARETQEAGRMDRVVDAREWHDDFRCAAGDQHAQFARRAIVASARTERLSRRERRLARRANAAARHRQ